LGQTAEGMWCIPETLEGAGSQGNRKKNQDTPIQDLSLTDLLYGCEMWKILIFYVLSKIKWLLLLLLDYKG